MKIRLYRLLFPLSIIFFVSSCTTIPDWREVTISPLLNIREDGIHNPVLTAGDVTDVPDANFVADPFLFHERGTWYMFFEVKVEGGNGDRSDRGREWG